jgi:hypothetical protein
VSRSGSLVTNLDPGAGPFPPAFAFLGPVPWDWDDGTRSVREADCPPFEPGATLERHFTADHVYRRSGNFSVRVILRRASRSVATASVSVGLR